MNKEKIIDKNKNYIRLLEFALNNIPEAVYINDNDGTILFVNKGAEINDGAYYNKVVGLKEKDIFDTESHQRVMDSKKAILDEVVPYTSVDGKYKLAHHSVYPCIEEEHICGTVSISKDITRVDQYTAKIFQLQQQLTLTKNSIYNNGTNYTINDIVGKSMPILKTLNYIQKAAQYHTNVLIIGKTGVGKELIAQSIHNASPNYNSPFIGLNCASIPETLIESILFGTTKGAFTGAKDMKGLFEQAKNGTLFLDEVDSIPMGIQAKLLRVLQEKKIRRIGSEKEIDVPCRIISATNADLAKTMEVGTFRSDLYYRLASVVIDVPTLKERIVDIPLLAYHFLEKFNLRFKTNLKHIDDRAIAALMNYNWPGNVRELEKTIERIIVLSEPDETIITINHIPPNIHEEQKEISINNDTINLNDIIDEYERNLILESLRNNNGNLCATARQLSIHRNSLTKKMKRLCIEKDSNMV